MDDDDLGSHEMIDRRRNVRGDGCIRKGGMGGEKGGMIIDIDDGYGLMLMLMVCYIFDMLNLFVVR
jgi:hypothetical protein